MGTASHAMWSPAWAGASEPRRSVAPLANAGPSGAPLRQILRDGLRLAAPVAATALAVAALAAPTTSRLKDLSTWMPNPVAATPAGPGAAAAGPAGDGHVTVRINRRTPRPAVGGPLTLSASPYMADQGAGSRAQPARWLTAPRATRPIPPSGPVAPRPAPASPAPAPASAAPPAPEATAAAAAPVPPAPTKRSTTTAKAKPKAAPATTEQQYTAASSGTGSTSPSDEHKSDKATGKADKGEGKADKGTGKAKNDR